MSEDSDIVDSITIQRHSMIGAVHWYVIEHPGWKTTRKFNHFKDAKRYAETIVSPDKIEVLG